MKKYLPFSASIAIMLLTVSSLHLQAQQIKISGKIKNESNEPLAGVNIVVKDKVIGTISNNDGDFYLQVKDTPPDPVVRFNDWLQKSGN